MDFENDLFEINLTIKVDICSLKRLCCYKKNSEQRSACFNQKKDFWHSVCVHLHLTYTVFFLISISEARMSWWRHCRSLLCKCHRSASRFITLSPLCCPPWHLWDSNWPFSWQRAAVMTIIYFWFFLFLNYAFNWEGQRKRANKIRNINVN